MIGYTTNGESEFHCTPASSRPSASAIATMVGSRSSRPMTSAASACSSVDSATAKPSGTPVMPLFRNRATNASTVDSVHTTVLMRATGMPSIDAAFGALGARPHGKPDAAAGQEPGHRADRQRRDDDRDQVVRVQDERADRELPVERRRDPLARQVAAPPARHQQAEHDHQLRDAEGGDGEHQSGRVPEPTDDPHLDHHAEHDGEQQPGAQADAGTATPRTG